MTTAVKRQRITPAMHFLYLLLIAAATIALGTFLGFLGGATEGYSGLVRPVFMPPDIVFSIVWPILYFMMAASFYITIVETPYTKETKALRIASIVLFAVQLTVNVTWPMIFFKADMYFFAFIWLAVLDALVTALVIINFKVNVWSAILLIPYLGWIIFATCLNVMIAVFN